MIWIPNQLVGAPLGTSVSLECHTESSPRAISFWKFNDNDNMVVSSDRFETSEKYHSEYKLDTKLTIKNLKPEDFGSYRCISKNSLGETDGTIMLYELDNDDDAEEEEEEAENDSDVDEEVEEDEDELLWSESESHFTDELDNEEDESESVDADREEERRRNRRRKANKRKQRQQRRKDSWFQGEAIKQCSNLCVVCIIR